ncbi:MAG: hypothetical protein COV76_03460 [Candidatus Omnitrophica bacterium CG11_big_fil_rev_8_21_14_0_20_64_10]|nr:MAG: hypothetical protein COV76_03460 [Candidatus Omnitrophica bacterium CG11_big_fil_rev_8_21_14_0_20_64_10]
MCHHSLKNFFAALFKKPFYVAFVNIFLRFERPLEIMARYVFGKGAYPAECAVRTPLGKIKATVYSFHDVITLVECFGKQDYAVPRDIACAVDFGSNIGISALYFLTRNPHVRAELFEPLPQNIERLRRNLSGFEGRYRLHPVAVGLKTGVAAFGIEPTGRYGGLNRKTSHGQIEVPVQSVDEILEEILSRQATIDVLKIDVEGMEENILQRLNPRHLDRIHRIFAETEDPGSLPGFFRRQYGAVARFNREKAATRA